MPKLDQKAIVAEVERAELWLMNNGEQEIQRIYRDIAQQTINDLRRTVDAFNAGDELTRSALFAAERETALLASLQRVAQSATETGGAYGVITAHTGDAAKLGYTSALYEIGANSDELVELVMNTSYFEALVDNNVRAQVGQYLSKQSNKTNAELLAILQQAYIEGIDSSAAGYKLVTDETYKKMATNINEYVAQDFRKARTILHNEMGSLYSAGNQQAIDRAQELGIEGEKTWYSNRDKKVRHSHAKLDGQKTELDGVFNSNGHEAQQPHQFGVAAEDINCRCRVHITRRGKQVKRNANGVDFDTFKEFRDYYASIAPV